jgi:hypothetical protein
VADPWEDVVKDGKADWFSDGGIGVAPSAEGESGQNQDRPLQKSARNDGICLTRRSADTAIAATPPIIATTGLCQSSHQCLRDPAEFRFPGREPRAPFEEGFSGFAVLMGHAHATRAAD